jgi:alpha-L-rhamnosidase
MSVDRPRLLAQLEIQTSDGETLVLVTDGSWRVAYGPILESDMLMGESYDARLDLPGWDLPGYDEGPATFPTVGWLPVQEFADTGAALVATNGPAVRRIEEFRPLTEPRELSAWPISRYIFDFGQNLTGWIRLRVRGPAGTTLTLRYAEVLAPDGSLYTENLRSARATDHYTLRGEGEEEWEPRFTFHGFRYVEVAGWPGAPGREALDAIVIHSDMAVTGEFECSDPLLNQLQHNILWGQKGNFLDVPTDCPQRDERLGWTGDAQVFARTAMFNMDVAAFFTKYQQDMADAQAANGAIPPVAPEPHGALMPDGGPAWADGFIIIPWTVYLCYGDGELLAQHYDAMARFIGYLRDSSIGFIRSHPDWQGWHGFGDWLALDGSGKTDGGTPKDLIGTAYFAHSAQLMARIATVLGKLGDAAQYQALYHNVRDAYLRRFVTADGLITGGTQTAYVLALRFGLLPESMRSRALEAIVRDIRARDNHLSTGFVGASHVPFVLSDNGRLDVAYELLNQQTWPSFLYAVTQGATTIWERWDGWTHDKGFQTPAMNSFNHYAYGAIGAWLYSVVAGLDIDPDRPGYRHIILRPRLGGGLTHARAAFHSLYGRIESAWRLEGGRFTWDVLVPPNTTATAHVPAGTGEMVMEGDAPAELSDGAIFLRYETEAAVYELAAGRYHFDVKV